MQLFPRLLRRPPLCSEALILLMAQSRSLSFICILRRQTSFSFRRTANNPVSYGLGCGRKGERYLDTDLLANLKTAIWHQSPGTTADYRIPNTKISGLPAFNVRSNGYCALDTYSFMNSDRTSGRHRCRHWWMVNNPGIVFHIKSTPS